MTQHGYEQVKAYKNYKQNTKLIFSFMKLLRNKNKLKRNKKKIKKYLIETKNHLYKVDDLNWDYAF